MSKKFTFEFIDLEGNHYFKEIEVLTCQTDLGEISILANHHPIITLCKKGKIKIKYNHQEEYLDLPFDALLEFKNNKAKILSIFELTQAKFRK